MTGRHLFPVSVLFCAVFLPAASYGLQTVPNSVQQKKAKDMPQDNQTSEAYLFDALPNLKPVPLETVHALLTGGHFTLRAYAATYLGARGNRESVPYLIQALKDESCHHGARYQDHGMACTRYRAYLSLKKLTGQNLEFTWDAAKEVRERQIAGWEQWWSGELVKWKVPASDAAVVEQWLAVQARAAQRGKPVRVRIPVAVRGDDWGCVCPRHYVGDSAASNAGTRNWIHPLGNTRMLGKVRNAVYVITGRLPGTTRMEDLRGRHTEAHELVYTLWDLDIESAARVRKDIDLHLERLE